MIGADPGGGRSNQIPGPARNMPYDWRKRPSYASGRAKRAIQTVRACVCVRARVRVCVCARARIQECPKTRV
jgi:hypothetical protein